MCFSSIWKGFVYFLAINSMLFTVAKSITGDAAFIYIPIVIDFLIFIAILFWQGHVTKKRIIFFIFFLLYLIFVALSVVADFGKFYPLFFGLNIMVCVFGLFYAQLDKRSFLKFSNIFFYIYLLLSFLDFNLNISGGIYKSYEFGVHGFAFRGLDGSPAGIDVFAMLFVLINYYYNSDYSRYINVLLGLLVVFLCGTLAPIFVLIVVFVTDFMMFIKLSNGTVLFSFIFSNIILLYFFGVVYGDNEFVHSLTNGRSVIWGAQLTNYFSNLSASSIFFGDTAAMVVDIAWGHHSTNNPHSSYLFVLFRFGLFFTVLSAAFLYFKSRKMVKEDFLIFMALLAAGFPGITPIYLANPFYILLGIFLILNNEKYNGYRLSRL